jgi:hypothetical protein
MTGSKTSATHTTHRDSGAAALLAMMFLVIFSSLAAAMAIVSQGNLTTADSSLKISRSLAAAETGMQFMVYRLNQVTQGDAFAGTPGIKTREGEVDADLANTLWTDARTQLQNLLADDFQYQQGNAPYIDGTTLFVPEIPVGPGQPQFSATFAPHPLADEDYDSAVYQRPPYSDMDPPVSNLAPLDSRWIHVTVTAGDGPVGSRIFRSVSIDFQIEKKIRFALLSKSRIMIGRNVMIDGPIGSAFTETNLENGHPVQMLSDFISLDVALDVKLSELVGTLADYDMDGDNRVNLAITAERDGLPIPAEDLDYNSDGYVDDYDFFMEHFDDNGDLKVSLVELDPTDSNVSRQQLLRMIDTFGNPSRQGYDDKVIDEYDRYAKIRGEVYITASKQGWEDGAADPDGVGGVYQDFFQGSIHPSFKSAPLTFDANINSVHEFSPSDFDVTSFKDLTSNDFAAQAGAPTGTVNEQVPYGAANPYEYYDRDVYDGKVFDNVRIPKGTNALFRNCTFVGVTFIDTAKDNADINFNYAGMQEADGTLKHPNRFATVSGAQLTDTKPVANNIRFDNCTFNGSVVTESPDEFTHVRNKLTFTGTTRFILQSPLTDEEIKIFSRSTLLAPHFSVEMGTFIAPEDDLETLELTGTIVTGVLDMRGQVKIVGTLLTTFEPISDTGPVLGDTSPQFNTTLGYFTSASGDLEADEDIPNTGLGVIQIRYDPSVPLPDGILGNIDITPFMATYREGGL